MIQFYVDPQQNLYFYLLNPQNGEVIAIVVIYRAGGVSVTQLNPPSV